MRTKLEPPDGGWGWVVAAASGVVFFLTYSLLVSNGILMVALMDVFNTGRAEMAWIPILSFAMARVTAPVSAILCNRLSHRIVALTGALLITVGYALGFLATTVPHLFLTLGITVGIGAGFAIMSSSILTTLYFKKRISLANGIYTAGASLGCICGPMFTQYLVQWMGLRFTFLILSAYSLHICIAASLFQPVEWHKRKVFQLPAIDVAVEKTPEAAIINKPTVNNGCLKDSRVFYATPSDIQQQLRSSNAAVTRMTNWKSSLRSHHGVGPLKLDAAQLEICKHRNAWDTTSITSTQSQNFDKCQLSRQVSVEVSTALQPVLESGELKNELNDRLSVDKTCNSNTNLSEKDCCSEHSANCAAGANHFDRRHSSRLSAILLSGIRQASIPSADPTHRLSVQTSRVDEDANNATRNGDAEPAAPDLSFFRRPVFYLMCFTAASFFTTLSVVGIIIPDFTRDELDERVSLERAAILLAIVSACDTTVRFMFSWLWDHPAVNKAYCHLCACIVCGSAFVAFVWVKTYTMAIVCCSLMGLASGVSGVLLTVLFRTYLGGQAFGLAFSSASLLSGIFMIAVGSFIGILKDTTGSYRSSFAIIGSFTVVSALAWLIAELCWKKKIGRRISNA